MQVHFARAELFDLQDEIALHLDSLPGPVDSFLEGHVRESRHYRIAMSDDSVGFASIHGGGLITQFSLQPAHQRFGQVAFQALRKLENVGAAFVPTCDEFFLSHAIDDYRQLAKQAYFFEAGPNQPAGDTVKGCSLRLATPGDADLIRQRSGEFFPDIGRQIQAEELFLTNKNGACAGFGILERSRFRPQVASIGMFTIEEARCSGVGTATIALLREECSRRGLRPVAGCWYYNHASKRTLERAGMLSRTRLLKVEY